jgi:hypothetical protein
MNQYIPLKASIYSRDKGLLLVDVLAARELESLEASWSGGRPLGEAHDGGPQLPYRRVKLPAPLTVDLCCGALVQALAVPATQHEGSVFILHPKLHVF